MAFGTGPFGTGAFGLPIGSTAIPQSTTIVTSQKIDAKASDYVVYDDGNHAGMDDIMQRILLLISFGVKRPALIGKDYEFDMRAKIRRALAPLLNVSPPTIQIEELTVETEGDSSFIYLRYKNMITNKSATVKV